MLIRWKNGFHFSILQKMLLWALLYVSPMHLCQSVPSFYLELDLQGVGRVHVHWTDGSFSFDLGSTDSFDFAVRSVDSSESHTRLASPQ